MLIDDIPYKNLYIDITDKCNMDCTFCYNPKRGNWFMPLDYFKEICERAPHKVNIRLLGGEPTLHPNLLDFIEIARYNGHEVFFASNGMMYNDFEFMEKLSSMKERFNAGLSIDGGYHHEYYKEINGIDCIHTKMASVTNLIVNGIKHVVLSAIIVRGLNEVVIQDLLDIAYTYPETFNFIHFRSATPIGKWVDTEPYAVEELKDLVKPYFTDHEFRPRCYGEISCGSDSENDCCYRFRPEKHLQISLIEFASAGSMCCLKRGKVHKDNFTVSQFFSDMLRTDIEKHREQIRPYNHFVSM